jgi:transposase-like protein
MKLNEIKQKKIFELDYEEIKHFYITLNMSQTDIAKIFKTDASNVSRKLKKENIKKENFRETQSIKQRMSSIVITKDMLLTEYPKLSITQISKKYNTSTSYIYNLLKKYGIEIVKNGYFQKQNLLIKNDKILLLTKEILYEKYIINEIPAHKIGLEFGVDKNFIYRKLKEFGINKRTKKEAFNTETNKNLRKEILIRNIGENLTNFKPNYNKKSITIIDDFGEKNGYSFKHAENGGEFFIEKYLYWLDGYDMEKNIVVEYYENSHKYKLKYDKNRIQNIKKELRCKIFIIHENGFIEEC